MQEIERAAAAVISEKQKIAQLQPKHKTPNYPSWQREMDEYMVSAVNYIPGTGSGRYHTFAELQYDDEVPQLDGHAATMQVFGLHAAKARLNTSIIRPLRAPQHYRHGGGILTFDDTLMIYGAESSGKRLLVKTFCAEHGINLVLVDHIGFEPAQDLPRIYEHARQCQPCVVLFDDCNGYFRPNAHPSVISALNRELVKTRQEVSKVWSVFISVENPRNASLHHLLRVAIDHSSWTGEIENNQLLNEAEILDVLATAIGRNLRSGDNPFTAHNMKQLAIFARNCTPGNIFSFIDKVWRCKADSMGLQHMATLSVDSPEMIPEWGFFEATLTRPGGGHQWMTEFDPYRVNIEPYGTAPPPQDDFVSAWDE